jgi:TrkA-N domain
VLAVADGAPRDPLTRQRRRPVRAVTSVLGRYLGHKLGLACLALFTMLAAGIDTGQAVVSVTNSDTVNLETALHARALASGPRIVLRLGDDDLAERVQRSVSNTISRSVSYLAAPTFAAAMLEHQVLRTIPVGRHVLLIADIRVAVGSDLAGRPVEDVHQTAQVRVIALRRPGTDQVDWSPGRRRLLGAAGPDLRPAIRAGLSTVLARSQPAQA